MHGFLETVRRVYLHTLRSFGLDHVAQDGDQVDAFMAQWQGLRPFPDVLPTLPILHRNFRLVVLSNGDPAFLEHLVTYQVPWDFDDVISVSAVGMFKPHPTGLPIRRLSPGYSQPAPVHGVLQFV